MESPRVSYIDRKERRLPVCVRERGRRIVREGQVGETGEGRQQGRVCQCACACVKISKENTFNKSLT